MKPAEPIYTDEALVALRHLSKQSVPNPHRPVAGSSALDPAPLEGGGDVSLAPPAPSPSTPLRCGVTLQIVDQPMASSRSTSPKSLERRRPRCIHPKGHHGPHWFGEA